MINWSAVTALVDCKATLYTKRNVPFTLVRYTEDSVWVAPQTGWSYTINRANLNKAVALLNHGGTIAGPGEYKTKIADDRPSYAWAILRHLSYL